MSEVEERTCWICFASEAENRRATWLHPCQCRGSTKWVHESCLCRWIDEKQNGNTRMRVACMQCRVEYLIVFPQVSRVANVLETLQDLIRQCSPFVAVSAFLGSVYWTAVTYGGLTVLQVYGQQRGMELLEKGDPLFLLLGLPFIPVALVLSRLIRWEDALLRLWHNRRHILRKLPLISWLFGDGSFTTTTTMATPPADEPLDVARVFCGAILLPSIATLLGNVLYRQVAVPLHRTLLGGITFIGVKGVLKIYLRQRQHLHKTRRHIVDYTEENLRAHPNSSQLELQRQIAGHHRQDVSEEELTTDDEDEDADDGDGDEEQPNAVEMIMAAFATASAAATVIDTAIGRISDSELQAQHDAAATDSDLDADQVIITVPDRPFSLFL